MVSFAAPNSPLRSLLRDHIDSLKEGPNPARIIEVGGNEFANAAVVDLILENRTAAVKLFRGDITMPQVKAKESVV